MAAGDHTGARRHSGGPRAARQRAYLQLWSVERLVTVTRVTPHASHPVSRPVTRDFQAGYQTCSVGQGGRQCSRHPGTGSRCGVDLARTSRCGLSDSCCSSCSRARSALPQPPSPSGITRTAHLVPVIPLAPLPALPIPQPGQGPSSPRARRVALVHSFGVAVRADYRIELTQ